MSQNYDVNMVSVSGEIVSSPSLVPLRSGGKMLIFTLKTVERFRRQTGETAAHFNFFTIEFLGASAERFRTAVSKGRRYAVSGYLRTDMLDDVQKTRVRGLHLTDLEDGRDD